MDATLVPVRHIERGRIVDEQELEYRSRDLSAGFSTPGLHLDELVWPRTDPFPAAECPIAEVIAFLVETGRRLDFDANETVREAFEHARIVNPLGAHALEGEYRVLGRFFDRETMEFEVDQALGGRYDGWKSVTRPGGYKMSIRPYPARCIHVIAGNSPGVGAISILRAALSRGVHLLKLPSNELFSTTAVLATMAQIDAEHPVVRSFSAAYWRGGDDTVESVLYRPQFFDKVLAWGGQAGLLNVQKYLGPGLELVPFDPKTSISVIGREAFKDDATLREAAAAAARHVGSQEGCGSSRVQFVEGTVDDVDRFCDALLEHLREQAARAGGGRITPPEICEHVEILRGLEPIYRVRGEVDGRGLVIRSEEPVDFDLIARTVNVVPIDDIATAARFINVATQTVGVHPASRKVEIRDIYAAAGAQRIVTLGAAGPSSLGRPHDAFYPLHRMVRWIVDEEELEGASRDGLVPADQD